MRSEAIAMIERVVKKSGLKVIGWRDVPVDSSVLGELSRDFVPSMKQIIVQPEAAKQFDTATSLDKALYEVRREIQGYFRVMKASEG